MSSPVHPSTRYRCTSRCSARESSFEPRHASMTEIKFDALDEKLLQHFPGKVVRKDLVIPLKGEYQVPNYVLEFLLGRYCASTDPEVVEAGLREVQRILTNHFVRSEQAPHI